MTMARILIVEDDASVRAVTARAIAAGGHSVETAEDGDLGLASIREAGGGYDLVLSDIRMPAMDGIEMAKRAAGEFPDLKILLMTGYAEQRERAADLERAVIDVVAKPFSLNDIRARVQQALALPASAGLPA